MKPPILDPSPMTARELLESVAGAYHAMHTVMSKRPINKGIICFYCSCGALCEVAATKDNTMALRNVMEVSG
jgi:hypothetical protein